MAKNSQRLNYRTLWVGLISAICIELIELDKKTDKTVEDIWITGTLQRVLSKMCALKKLPPRLQKLKELTRPLFGE